MTYNENLCVFFVLLVGIIIVPGMDMLFVLANGIAGGRRGGLAATAGIMLGGVFHTVVAVVGIGAVIGLVPGAYQVLMVVGAGYMAWIGLSLARSSPEVGLASAAGSRSHWLAFRQGTVTAILNPKAYLFTLSVFPQFIAPRYGSLWWQGLVLGSLVVLTQLGIYGGLALLAGRTRGALLSHPALTRIITRGAGLLLMIVAALAVWQGWRTPSASLP